MYLLVWDRLCFTEVLSNECGGGLGINVSYYTKEVWVCSRNKESKRGDLQLSGKIWEIGAPQSLLRQYEKRKKGDNHFGVTG